MSNVASFFFVLEFLSLNLLNDLFFHLRKKKEITNFMVPLSCVIEYKGCKSFVICNPPIKGSKTLAQGALSEQDYRVCSNINNDLKIIGRNLKIKVENNILIVFSPSIYYYTYINS